MNLKFLILLCFSFFLTIPVQARMVELVEEDVKQEDIAEGYYELTPELIEGFIEEEEQQLRNLETLHEYNLKTLPELSFVPEGQENTDEIRKLVLFIVKMMVEGNYKNHEDMFEREGFRTFFGERSYGQINDFLKSYTDQNKELDTFYLLETQCTPKVTKVSVGGDSKRWELSLIANYITIHKYLGSLLTLENGLVDHSSKWDKKQFLIYMDIRNRVNDTGKNRYQFRNILFQEITEDVRKNMNLLLECSEREKLLHEIAIYDSKSIKAGARIKALNMVLDILENNDVEDLNLNQ